MLVAVRPMTSKVWRVALVDIGLHPRAVSLGAIRLVTGWIMMERDPLGAEPILAEARSALEPGKSPLLVAASQLLGAAQVTSPAAQQTLKDALSASEAAVTPRLVDSMSARVDSRDTCRDCQTTTC